MCPPRIWSWVDTAMTSPLGLIRYCALGEYFSGASMNSSTTPPMREYFSK